MRLAWPRRHSGCATTTQQLASLCRQSGTSSWLVVRLWIARTLTCHAVEIHACMHSDGWKVCCGDRASCVKRHHKRAEFSTNRTLRNLTSGHVSLFPCSDSWTDSDTRRLVPHFCSTVDFLVNFSCRPGICLLQQTSTQHFTQFLLFFLFLSPGWKWSLFDAEWPEVLGRVAGGQVDDGKQRGDGTGRNQVAVLIF